MEEEIPVIDYDKAAKYWNDVDPTIDGMLGGFGEVSTPDLKDSATFLKTLFKETKKFSGPSNGRALDCGAGIGRISRNLLSKHFTNVDIVEQCPKFIEKAKKYCGSEEKIENFTCTGLQEYTPKDNLYDVIWCQWVLSHLTDDDLVQFFVRCKKGLRPNGLLVVKENLTSSGCADVDKEDGSATRPEEIFQRIFKEAGYSVVKEMYQRNFPKDLYTVKMFALKPK
ncbi:N-terminal Xaa-Pro-Lys N-methyltransferase 1 [Lepeophtheirus salmonis]|uniref:Alpha N-terminal protein methyltransferase 1 n=2 Tax=Lepeophtheirus salmonis TaxID=72036 RepID=D3PG00_LEPSM|nr:N-terminal Xaa-Pro-Lys N-methyltransferase 1-like [Lepeophtheirus salmonis]ADD24196.1 Methyltransferase-like protein 11A [Lepeophtheirus salmonis]